MRTQRTEPDHEKILQDTKPHSDFTSALSFVLRNSNKSEMISPTETLSLYQLHFTLVFDALKGDKKLILDFFSAYSSFYEETLTHHHHPLDMTLT